MSGIVIQNKGNGRGMMLPVREGKIENRLPFVSACGPIGLNPTNINKVIVKSNKLKPIVKVDKKQMLEDKLYPLENYRKLKTTEAFWKKNENPLFEDFNQKQNENKNKNENLVSNESQPKIETISKNKKIKKSKILIDEEQKNIKEEENVKNEIEEKTFEVKTEDKKVEKVDENKEKKVDENKEENVDEKKEEKVEEMNKDEAEKLIRETINEDPLLEDLDDNENIDDILDYLNGLDYDKYNKDKQIREALELLKNKMNKECEEKEKENEKGKVTVIEDESSKKKEIVKTDEENENNIVENKLKLPEINNKIPEQKNVEIVNDEEIKRAEEIKKYKIAEKIAKTDEMKAVHSVNSIRKLLQREGLENPSASAPLQITIIKENPIAGTVDYQPNKLPFLHSLPLV